MILIVQCLWYTYILQTKWLKKKEILIYIFSSILIAMKILTHHFIGSIRLAIWNSSVYGYWQFVDDRMSNV